MLGIGNIAKRMAVIVHTIAGGAVGMVQGRGYDLDFISQVPGVTGGKVLEIDLRLHDLDRHRESRLVHLRCQNLTNAAALIAQMPGHDGKVMIFLESGREEREAVDVIPMGVGQHHVRMMHILFHQPVTQIANAGPSVKDNSAASA